MYCCFELPVIMKTDAVHHTLLPAPHVHTPHVFKASLNGIAPTQIAKGGQWMGTRGPDGA